MGPDLWELFEDGKADDEVAAIVRLGHSAALPKGIRVVTQFGEIITIRTTRENLPDISGAPEVADIAAGNTYLGPDLELETDAGAEYSTDTVLPTDQRRPSDEKATGRGVVIGVVDWGFDFAHPDFLKEDGTSRILAIWDQRGSKLPNSPKPFGYGVVHDRDAINRALKERDPYAALGYHPADSDGGTGSHGTHVLSIAAGSGGEDRPSGIAPEADLVVVHNAPWDEVDTGRLGDSVTLLEGIDFISRTAGDRPWVINLSMGRHGEQHDGTTLIERGLDSAIRLAPGRAVCQSTGNYFNKHIHASGQLRPTQERTLVWHILEGKPTNNQLEFWYSWQDKFEVTVRSPDGSITARVAIGERSKFLVGGKEVGNVYHRGQEPNNLDNHITVYLYEDAPAGEWEITLTGVDIIDGRYHAWIERDVSCPSCQSRLRPEDSDPRCTTGTICNGRRTLAVGAYDAHDPEMRVAYFSSVGPTRDGRLKPDLCAPGVGVLAARSTPRGLEPSPRTVRFSGTSMACPHVTGTVALMFQAAPRRLRIEETHNLLLQSARKVSVPEEIPERIGIGYLDVEEAVDAARKVASGTSTFKQTTVLAPAAQPASTTAPNPPTPKPAHEGTEVADDERIQTPAAAPSIQGAAAESPEKIGPLIALDLVATSLLDQPTSPDAEEEVAVEDSHETDEKLVSNFAATDDASTEISPASAPSTPAILTPAPAHTAARSLDSELVELADQIVDELDQPRSAVHVLHEMFDRSDSVESLPTLDGVTKPSAAQIYDSFVYEYNPSLNQRLSANFEVVARPGESLDVPVRAGDIMVRRAEGGSAHVSIVASAGTRSLQSAQVEGLTTESRTSGEYVQVIEAGPMAHESDDKYARQLADGAGRVLNDILLLRATAPQPQFITINQPAAAPAKEEPGSSSPGESVGQLDTGTFADNTDRYDMTEVAPVVSHHAITLKSGALRYTATAGRLPIKTGEGVIEAQVFFVAYTLDGQDATKRPITFAFNGGPGSASLWLHMGALGPRKVVLQPDGFLPPAPYKIETNPYTILDVSDVVFVDAIGTGFSRASDSNTFERFWSVDGDIESFGEFIRLYITRNERWGSPLFLFGESYGTLRAAGIAGYLSTKGISFNGITLLSTVLNYQTLEATKTNDQPYTFLIPTFTNIAAYHHKLPPDLASDANRARQESEKWAAGDYALALAKGDALSSADRQRVIDQMARLTGLDKDVIDQADLRIDVGKFTHYLLLDRKLRVGRFDGRFTGPDPHGLLDTQFYDPTEAATHPPFTSVFNNYLRTELRYKTDMPYYTRAQDADSSTWNWGSAIGGFPDTASALRHAMLRNPYLKILVMEGYYDLATPYSAANYTIDHLELPPTYRKNVSFATYEAGHMVYLPEAGLKKMNDDQAKFVRGNVSPAPRTSFESTAEFSAQAFAEDDVSTLRDTRGISLKDLATGTIGQLPDDILEAILTRGETDANALTNRVFWAEHPALAGVDLDPKSPAQKALRDEWSNILRRRVLPNIWLRALIAVLDRHPGSFPRDFLLGWIAVECDGNFRAHVGDNELGYFQIMWSTGEAREQLNLTRAQFDRLITDPEFSIEQGVKLAETYRQFIRKHFPSINDGSELLFRLTKGRHAAPASLNAALVHLVTSQTDITWDSVSPLLPSDTRRNIDQTMDFAAGLAARAALVPESAQVPAAAPAAPASVGGHELVEFGEGEGPLGAITESFPHAESLAIDEWVKMKLVLDGIGSGGIFQEVEFADSSAFHPANLAELTGFGYLRKTGAAATAPYELRFKGCIWYPRGSSKGTIAGTRALPVAILLHGRHNWNGPDGKEIPSYLGYQYLQEELAHHGIVSFSVATNAADLMNLFVRTRADFVLEALKKLQTLNSQPGMFQNRLDLHNVGIMGHSRGGDGVVKAATMLRANPDFTVRALCSIAPTDDTGLAVNPLTLNASDTFRYLVLYGSYDSDVFGSVPDGSGFRHYDRADCQRTMVFVNKIRHNGFNTVWAPTDEFHDPLECPADTGALRRSAHKQLAIDYVGGLFRLELNHETSLKGFFDGSRAPSGKHEIATQWSSPSKPRAITTVLFGTPLRKTAKWTLDWTTLLPLKLVGTDTPHLFGYKKGCGKVTIDRVVDPHRDTQSITGGTWRDGWTHFMPFFLPGDDRPYLLAYMDDTGDVAIHRIARNGTDVELNIWKETRVKGWSSFMPVSLPKNDAPFYLAYRKDTGEFNLDSLKPKAQGTDNVFKGSLPKGITLFVPLRLPGDERQFFLAYSQDSGNVTISRIAEDGKNITVVWTHSWTAGWSAIEPFRALGDDRIHLLLYKTSDGSVFVERIRRDALGTETILQDSWSTGWSHFVTFEWKGKPHYLAYMVAAGDIAIGSLLPDQMLEIENFEVSATGGPYDQTRDLLNAAAALTDVSQIFFMGAVPPMSALEVPHQTHVIRGDKAGAKYRAEIPPENRDCLGFDLLTFRLTSAFDLTSQDSINKGKFPDFKVRVFFGKTGGGTVTSAEVDQTAIDTTGVRRRQPPFFRHIGGGCINVTKVVLQTIAIKLSKFPGVNWSDVRAIEFEAGSGVVEPLFFDSLALMQS